MSARKELLERFLRRPAIREALAAWEARERRTRASCETCQFEHQVEDCCMNPSCPDSYYAKNPS